MLRLADRLPKWAADPPFSFQRAFWPLMGVALLFTLATALLLVQGLQSRAQQINLAGQQRMHIQKMAKDALAIVHQAHLSARTRGPSEWERASWDLPASMARFQQAQRWLLRGTHLGTPMDPVSDPEARRRLQRVNALWDSYRSDLETILADPAEVPVARQEAILAQARSLWQAMDEAVARLEEVSRQGTRYRRLLALLLVGGISAILLLGGGAAHAHFQTANIRQRLDRILKEVPDLVFYKDERFRYLGANAAFAGFTGRSQTDIYHQSDFDLFDPDTAAFFREKDREMLASGESRRNREWVQYPDGRWLYLDMLKAPLDLGNGRTGVLGIGRDLTEYKRSEENRERLAATVEAAPDVIGFSDLGDPPLPTYVNPAGKVLLGAEFGEEEEGIFAYYPRSELGRIQEEAIPQALEEGSWRGETTLIAADGTEIPVEQTLMGHKDAAGRPSQLSTIIRDLRPQKRAEEAWRRMAVLEESVANTLIDAVPGIFFLFDESGQFHRWNDRAESLTGMTPEEIRSRHPMDFFPETERELLAEAIERAFREGIAEVEASFLTREGPVPFYFRSERMELEGRPYLCGIGLDISRRKELEEEQRLLAQPFHTHQALMITDPEARIERVNPAFTAITGYAPEEIIGTDPGILASGLHDRAFYERMWPDLKEHDRWEGEIWNRRKDGTVFPAREAISAVRDEAGRLEHYVALFHDITERKEAEAERDRLIEILEGTPDFIGMADADGNIIYHNRSAWQLLGYPPDTDPAAVTRPTVHPEWAWHRVRYEGIPTAMREGWWSGETALVDAEGREIPVSQIILAHRDPEGELQRTSTIMRDLSEQKALQAELEYQASHDPLTGLFNRRRFGTFLRKEVQRVERYGGTFALLMFDIDHFKAINDAHGHETGDQVLTELTGIVAERLRDADILARWGGEEFLALLPNTGLDGALELAEAVRGEGAATAFRGGGPVTVSVGVAEYRDGDSPEDLVRRLDEALYAAKGQGRNRTEVG